MARGRNQPGVKTHRRGRRRRTRRRFPVAPWIVISTVVTLVASGMVLGYTWLLGTGCSGDFVRATVVAAPDIKEPLSVLARQWEREEPSISGRCIGVEIKEKSSAEVATKLAANWNTVTDGARPHVWIPDSSVWVQMAESSDAGALMIPDQTPYVATSPTVIAMPKPMAEALGWQSDGEPVDLEASWPNLLELAESSTWADFGHEEWGDIKLGMSSPRYSTAGMHALLSLTDVDRNGDVVSEELDNVVRLKQVLTESPDDTDAILQELAGLDPEAVNDYVSAFPALERDVWRYNNYMQNGVELTAVYPSDGSLDADHPIAVLQNAEWTNDTYQEIGWQFAEFITGDQGREVLLNEAFRDGTRRTGGETLNDTAGLTPQIDESQRGPVLPTAVGGAMAAWLALDRPANVLVVLDTSESMGSVVQHNGEEVTRLEVVRRELSDALGLFGSQANVGLWEYSTASYYDAPDYNELVPIGEFDSDQEQAIGNAVQQLVYGGGSALFDTAAAAYEELLNNYNDAAGAANLVVLISDGGNEDENGGLGLAELETRLDELSSADRSKKASIVTIGFGSDIDEDALTAIADATQGKFFEAEWNDQLKPQLLNALFNAV